MLNRLVAAILIIISIVIRTTNDTMYLFGILAKKINLRIIEYLVMLECGKLLHVLLHS